MTGAIAFLNESPVPAGSEPSTPSWPKRSAAPALRTVQSYSRMLRDFIGRGGKRPDEVASQEVFAWAYGPGLSGKELGSITIGARLACLSRAATPTAASSAKPKRHRPAEPTARVSAPIIGYLMQGN